mgnify:CR=1 FL=1
MQLSKNFSLKELTASQTADRHGISNNPSEDHMDNLKKLCDNCLLYTSPSPRDRQKSRMPSSA